MAGTGEADYTTGTDQFRPSAEGGSTSAAEATSCAGDRGASASAASASVADQDLYGGMAAARAATSGHLRRSQSAAGTDRLGFRAAASGSGHGDERLLAWHDTTAYGAVTGYPHAIGGIGASGQPLGALDVARRLTLGPQPLPPGLEFGDARRDLAGRCPGHEGVGESCPWQRSHQHTHFRRHRYASAAPAQHPMSLALAAGSEPAASMADRGGAATERQRSWQFPWLRSRKSDVLPAGAGQGSSGSADCGGKEEAAVACLELTSKPPSKRGSKVRRKCSQLVKAIRSRLGRKKGARGKHGLAALHHRQSTSAEGVDRRPQEQLQSWPLELDVSDFTVEAGGGGGSRSWEADADARAASAVESVGGGWQWHRGVATALAPVIGGASGVAQYPRERHHAVRIAPRSPPGPMRSLAGQQLHPAAAAYSITSALASAAAANVGAVSSLAMTSGGAAAGVRAHTTVDYAHFLVPDLRSIASSAYYWCVMDRYEAERALEGKPEGTFLLRDSAQDDFLFSVSFRRYGRSLHARVEQRDHAFSFDAHDVGVFRSPTVTGLVEHYKDADSCLFFEPLLTRPLPRPQPLSLLQLARSALCGAGVTYDGVAQLPLPRPLVEYVRYYHYKHKVRSRTVQPAVSATTAVAAAVSSAGAAAALQQPES